MGKLCITNVLLAKTNEFDENQVKFMRYFNINRNLKNTTRRH